MGKLFGTDGVRGIANIELTCELAMNIGRAAALVLSGNVNKKPKIIIGQDTRISSPMLEMAIAAGICSVGADAILLGVVPTPAVAYLVGQHGADAGVMISASHNPVEYNGIKLFDSSGLKLPDEIEDKIEEIIMDGLIAIPLKSGTDLGHIIFDYSAVDKYIDHIKKSVHGDLKGLRIGIDCANGSASVTARKLFLALGADCVFINDIPDGTNINKECGSTYMGQLSALVNKKKCDFGIAFDGDADRCLAVDENGDLIDGDKIIAIFSKYLMEKGKLYNNTAVVTVMSNLGFFVFAKNNGISTATTKVGDRYVLEEMQANGYSIGGEQSGHIIMSEFATTGDGQLTGVHLARILLDSKQKMSEVAEIMEVYPQVMINNKVSNEAKIGLNNDEIILEVIKECECLLGDHGRVLVRASGTEPLIRVMVEGKDLSQIKEYANKISDKIKERLS